MTEVTEFRKLPGPEKYEVVMKYLLNSPKSTWAVLVFDLFKNLSRLDQRNLLKNFIDVMK